MGGGWGGVNAASQKRRLKALGCLLTFPHFPAFFFRRLRRLRRHRRHRHLCLIRLNQPSQFTELRLPRRRKKKKKHQNSNASGSNELRRRADRRGRRVCEPSISDSAARTKKVKKDGGLLCRPPRTRRRTVEHLAEFQTATRELRS